MSEPASASFRALVAERFRFLEDHGFRRSVADELESPTATSVVYVGRHVGFVVSHDARDDEVDVRVARVRDGRLAGPGSRDLLAHLVEHGGYRGGFPAPEGPRSVAGLVDGWAELLRTEGATLLADPEDLPGL